MKQIFLFLFSTVVIARAGAQTASFNFTLAPTTVSGWVNISGNPASGLRSGTDVTTGITVSSIATSHWAPYTDGESAFDGGGISGGTFFPSGVMLNHWFQYNPMFADFNAVIPQLKVSGLNKDSIYSLRMTGSFGTGFDLNPTQYSVLGVRRYGSIDVNNNNNTSRGAVFEDVFPDSTGSIYVYVNTVPGTQAADICGVQVTRGSVGSFPAVAITQPLANAGLSEDNTVIVAATASEAGGAIAQVQLFADTVLLGTLTNPPYQVSWAGADPGVHTIIASATDTSGNSNSASITVLVQSVNFYWSTTGNTGNDSTNFLGNVDSVRMDLRTKHITQVSISAVGNVGIGTTVPTALLHTTGSVRLAGLTNDSTASDPNVLVSDVNGNLAWRDTADLGLAVGGGLSRTAGDTMSLGQPVAGPSGREFLSTRYEYLNGHFYSPGGKTNDPVAMPDLRLYDNGDLAAGTTMDRSVNTNSMTGLRYYAKLGLVQIGATDRQDTTASRIVLGTWPNSGLLINSDSSNPVKSRLLNSIIAAHASPLDTGAYIQNSLLAANTQHITASMKQMTNTLLTGGVMSITAPVNNSILAGTNHSLPKPVYASGIIGFLHQQQDTATASLIAGGGNDFGGEGQLISGQVLGDPAPYGFMIGNSNTWFTSLSYTGTKGTNVSGLAGYPLFVLANSSNNLGSGSSNAVTVMYNGRTQISTIGLNNVLTPTQVTPKAALEIVSTTSGVLFPRLTAAQIGAIASGDLSTGLLLFNSDAGSYQFYNGSAWMPVGARGGISNVWDNIGNTATSPSTNFVGTTDSERVVFRTHNIERMTVMANGVIGIGTSSPQTGAKLAVKGTIYAQRIEVIETGWADYVFDPTYSLLPLPRLQKYIDRYRRLPGVISAEEAADDGVDLGQNQAVLLQKIEELTLYLIEAHKKTDERQQEIELLKARGNRIDQQQKELATLRQELERLMGQNKLRQ